MDKKDLKKMTGEQYLDYVIDKTERERGLYYLVYDKLVEYKFFTKEELEVERNLMEDEFNQDVNVEMLNKSIRARYNTFDFANDWIELFENAYSEGYTDIKSWDDFMAEFEKYDELIDWQ